MELFKEKLSSRLSDHITNIDLARLSRIDAERLQARALPNIGTIELVSAEAFDVSYKALYLSMFKPTERERSDRIIDRLKKEWAGERKHLAPYYIVGIKSPSGAPIGAAQFSVLFISHHNSAVPYLQYIYMRPENRRQDMAEVLHIMILAVATTHAMKLKFKVPFTLFETEPPGYGDDEASRNKSKQRAEIHTKAGAVALMLHKTDGGLVSLHVQPGLEVGEPPLIVVWAIRKSPGFTFEVDAQAIGPAVVAAYYRSLRDEEFPEQNIQLAEQMVAERCEGSIFVLMPLNDVPATVTRFTNLDSRAIDSHLDVHSH